MPLCIVFTQKRTLHGFISLHESVDTHLRYMSYTRTRGTYDRMMGLSEFSANKSLFLALKQEEHEEYDPKRPTRQNW